MEYKVILEAFEGPMDLLLYLIEKSKIDIYDIPINEITEQYLDYLSKMGEMDLEITSEFLVMAATLLEIKSKMLLPQTVKETSGMQLEMEEADPRLELVQSLVEYKKYKYASKKLREYEEIQNKVYYKPKEDLSYFSNEELQLEDMDLNKLIKVFKKIIMKNSKEKVLKLNEIQNEEYTLKKCILNIKNMLNKRRKIKFSQLFNCNSSKKEIVATFLSLLELVRNKYIKVYQKGNFEEILICKTNEEGDKLNG